MLADEAHDSVRTQIAQAQAALRGTIDLHRSRIQRVAAEPMPLHESSQRAMLREPRSELRLCKVLQQSVLFIELIRASRATHAQLPLGPTSWKLLVRPSAPTLQAHEVPTSAAQGYLQRLCANRAIRDSPSYTLPPQFLKISDPLVDRCGNAERPRLEMKHECLLQQIRV